MLGDFSSKRTSDSSCSIKTIYCFPRRGRQYTLERVLPL